MKRGVGENNKGGPMFPRLHVNDTEKGGPRAPPRNKMALYEQLSIPSQRLISINPNPTCTSQGVVRGKGLFSPLDLQTPLTNPADKINYPYSELIVQQEQKKKQEDDDDYSRVPIFNQESGINLDCSQNHENNEGLSPLISSFSGRFTNILRNNSQESSKSALNQSSKQNTKSQMKETNGCWSFDHRNALNNNNNNNNNNNSIRIIQSNGDSREADDNSNSISNETSIIRARNVQNDDVITINGDAVSETSMVDSVSGASAADISPDDVVGVIGQKHFWKARRAIVNQQRLFGVQVFELHRLIKVQRLIAGLSLPMLEEDAVPQKVSPIKKQLDRVPKSSAAAANVPKVKDHYHDKSKEEEEEFSACEKASLSSVHNNNNSGPVTTMYPSFPPSDPPRMGLWGPNHHHHPPGHQWLIPVMSPSEGLIYKPYYPGSTPPMFGQNHGGLPPPAQQPPHYQWHTGFPPPPPPPAHGYFPPYGMTAMHASGCEDTNHRLPKYKSAVAHDVSNNSEVQVSTATSLLNDRSVENRDALPLFPTCPPSESEGVGPSHVIKVVPRNARLANESVARIFQSIQDERERGRIRFKD